MEFHERIGTMVITATDSYIVGASDKLNEEFKKKCQNKIKIDKRDTVELSCIKKMVFPSENYENYLKTTTMPKSCFSDKYGHEMQNSIAQSVWAYCYGEMTDEQIQKELMDACKDMRVYQAQSGHTSGVDANDNMQIIREVYEIFQKSNVRAMVNKCFDAGVDIANANGGSEKNNWVYYDSKYYDESQHLRDLLQKAANEMAAEWNIGYIDFEKIEKESKLILDGKLDFNSVWDFHAHQRNICSLSSDWQPQEHFSFFYQSNKHKEYSKENTLDSQAGICIIGFENHKWAMDVPFNNSAVLGELADNFNAKDLFVKNSRYMEPNLLKYLEHFDIYTRFYAHNQTMKGKW